MKNIDLFRIRQGLEKLSDRKGVRFAYIVVKNKKILDDELEILRKSIEPSENFSEFEQKRVELCETHAKKDENGQSILDGGNYVIETKEVFDKEMTKLREEFKDTLDERIKQQEDYEKLLQQETDVELKKIKFEELPNDITASELEQIKELIEEE